ncbi:polysaccharide pyruvyl transferase family protein, partial [Streptomyces sp. BRB040]
MTHSSLASASDVSSSAVSSSAVSSSAASPSVADDRSTVTGRRRIAFAAHTGRDGLPGLAALLRSLALTNPRVCEDFVVLHPGLPDSSFDGLRRLHPRVVTRPADDRRAVFGLEGYDTVMALGPGMVVLGDLGELLRMRPRLGGGAPPQQAG